MAERRLRCVLMLTCDICTTKSVGLNNQYVFSVLTIELLGLRSEADGREKARCVLILTCHICTTKSVGLNMSLVS